MEPGFFVKQRSVRIDSIQVLGQPFLEKGLHVPVLFTIKGEAKLHVASVPIPAAIKGHVSVLDAFGPAAKIIP
jgi:hypothetical protein